MSHWVVWKKKFPNIYDCDISIFNHNICVVNTNIWVSETFDFRPFSLLLFEKIQEKQKLRSKKRTLVPFKSKLNDFKLTKWVSLERFTLSWASTSPNIRLSSTSCTTVADNRASISSPSLRSKSPYSPKAPQNVKRLDRGRLGRSENEPARILRPISLWTAQSAINSFRFRTFDYIGKHFRTVRGMRVVSFCFVCAIVSFQKILIVEL